MKNCERTAIVDFGNGPVEVQCTKKGYHKRCVCVVFIQGNRGRIAGATEIQKSLVSQEKQ